MRRPLGVRKSKIFNLRRTPNDLELGENILEPILQYHKRNLFVALSNAYHLLMKTKFKSDNNVAPIFGELKFSIVKNMRREYRWYDTSKIYTSADLKIQIQSYCSSHGNRFRKKWIFWSIISTVRKNTLRCKASRSGHGGFQSRLWIFS